MSGWRFDSVRHSLAARGIRTYHSNKRIESYVERVMPREWIVEKGMESHDSKTADEAFVKGRERLAGELKWGEKDLNRIESARALQEVENQLIDATARKDKEEVVRLGVLQSQLLDEVRKNKEASR